VSSVKAKVKPELLRWARESAGYSVTEAARKLSKLAPERLEQWESGEDQPTIAQLRHMARVYRRPLSVFYLPEVPMFPVMHDFRRLPGEVSDQYSSALVSEAMTTTITFDFDASAFGAFRLSPGEFAQEMRIAAAVQWYAQGIVSQGKAAELAELTRAEFLEELHRRKVPACQVTADELANEIHGAI